MTTSAAIPNPLRRDVYSFWAMEPESVWRVLRLMRESASEALFDRALTSDWRRRVARRADLHTTVASKALERIHRAE